MPRPSKERPAMLEALNDNVVVEMDPAEAMTRSGLLVPERFRRPSFEGMVVSVGPGRRDHKTGHLLPMEPGLKPGVRIAFGWQDGGVEVEHGGKTYRLLIPDAILGILEDK